MQENLNYKHWLNPFMVSHESPLAASHSPSKLEHFMPFVLTGAIKNTKTLAKLI